MLIITDRHTSADLECWADYEEMDALISVPRWKIEQSKRVMAGWLVSHADAVAMTSWGKDSGVMLHLLAMMGATMPVVHVATDHANPDADLVRDAFLAQWPFDYHEPTYVYDEVAKNDGHWKDAARRFGQHRITGIRKDEAGIRELVYARWGFSSENSCRPLSLWTGEEIFAYSYQQGIPLSPVYGYLGGGRWPRPMIRMHSLAGKSGDGIGRTEWEREYYPDMLARIAAIQHKH